MVGAVLSHQVYEAMCLKLAIFADAPAGLVRLEREIVVIVVDVMITYGWAASVRM
jgi:hypothetical protein